MVCSLFFFRISINETLLGSRVVLATRLVENLVNGGEKDLSRNELWDYVTAPQSDSLQREHSRIDSTPPVFYNLAGPPVPLSSCSVEQVGNQLLLDKYPVYTVSPQFTQGRIYAHLYLCHHLLQVKAVT